VSALIEYGYSDVFPYQATLIQIRTQLSSDTGECVISTAYLNDDVCTHRASQIHNISEGGSASEINQIDLMRASDKSHLFEIDLDNLDQSRLI
jgi:hypothetical protein